MRRWRAAASRPQTRGARAVPSRLAWNPSSRLAWLALAMGCTPNAPSVAPRDDTGDDTVDVVVPDDTGVPGLGTDTGTDAADSGVDTDAAPCAAGLRGTFPAAGDVGVYTRPLLTASFDADERGTASFVLEETSSGDLVPLSAPSWSDGGREAWLEPLEPLAPEASYTWLVSGSCGMLDAVGFTTGVVGTAVDASMLVGRSWVMDLGDLQVVEPAGLAVLLSPALAALPDRLALAVTAADVDRVDLTLALATAGGGAWSQDLCDPTVDLGWSDYSRNPYFEAGGSAMSVPLGGATLDLFQATIGGSFAPGGQAVAGLTVRGALDTRPLVQLLAPGQGGNGVCQLVNVLSGFRVSCSACPDGSGPYCLGLVLADGDAAEAPGLSVVNRSIDDIASDATCMP